MCTGGGKHKRKACKIFPSLDSLVAGISWEEELCSLAGYVPRVFQPSENLANADLDEDGLPMVWERTYGLDEFVDDSSADVDMDGLSNLQEFNEGTSPTHVPIQIWTD